MRFSRFLALTLGTAMLVVLAANGQPPPDGGFGKGFKGPKGQKGQKGANIFNTNSVQLLDELKLSDEQREKARQLLRTHDDTMRKAALQARKDLLVSMKDVLNEGDYKTFKEELDLVPLLPAIPQNLRTISTDDLVERLMAYDKNGDGKVTKDELPERMHGLITQGDLNGDGALDRDEIKKLAERPGRGGFGGPGGPGGGPGGRRGPGGPPPFGRSPQE